LATRADTPAALAILAEHEAGVVAAGRAELAVLRVAAQALRALVEPRWRSFGHREIREGGSPPGGCK
jgi:hypothetical protein